MESPKRHLTPSKGAYLSTALTASPPDIPDHLTWRPGAREAARDCVEAVYGDCSKILALKNFLRVRSGSAIAEKN